MPLPSIRQCFTLLAFPLALALGGPAHAGAFDLPGAAPAAPDPLPDYAAQRVRSFFVTRKNAGIQPVTIDLERLDACLAALRLHAGNPKPRFNTATEQTQAGRDAAQIAAALAGLTASDAASARVLLRAALALTLAHNLGTPGAGAIADTRFERLLAKVPDNSEALYEYGVYLTNSGRAEQAQAPLKQALAAGELRARWPLALALAALGQTADAQLQLEALQDRSANQARDYPVAATLAALRASPNPAPAPAPRP